MLELPVVKEFILLDYKASVAFNPRHKLRYTLSINNEISNKIVFSARYSNVSLMCYELHKEMLKHSYHALNPSLTLDAVESVRDGMELWMYEEYKKYEE